MIWPSVKRQSRRVAIGRNRRLCRNRMLAGSPGLRLVLGRVCRSLFAGAVHLGFHSSPGRILLFLCLKLFMSGQVLNDRFFLFASEQVL